MVQRNINVSLSLVSFAGKVEVAREPKPETRNLCVGQPGKPAHDATLLKQPSMCESCGEVTDRKVLVKGVKQGNTYALVQQDDIVEAKNDTAALYKGKVDLIGCPSADFLAQTAVGKNLYYLTPAAGAEDQYQMVRQLVEKHPEVSFNGYYTPSSVAGLYVLSARSGVLCLEERTNEQGLKPVPQVGGTVGPMYDLLEAVLDKIVTPYDPDAYEDKYALKLAQLALDATDSVTVSTGAKAATPLAVVPDTDLAEKLRALAAS
jgi:non-homologous end joining protein Ku